MKTLQTPRGKINIGALNCQGLKGKIDDPQLQNIIATDDIFGVSETWLTNQDLITLPGYKFYPYNREKVKGTTRGGVGIFIKEEIRKFIKILYDISSDNLRIKLEKSNFQYDDDVYIGMVYFPPKYSSREKRLNFEHFKHITETVRKINSNNIILMGDFNARTQNLDDTLITEKHDNNMPDHFYSEILTKRSNQDTILNAYGKKLIEYCVTTHSFIANGRTLGDLQGKYTCHETRGSSTVDYAIINENLRKHINTFKVMDPSTGSDHCPIKLELSIPKNNSITAETTNTINKQKLKWNERTKKFFLMHINTQKTKEEIEEIEKLLESDENNIDLVVQKLNNIYENAIINKNDQKKKTKKKETKKWYDKTCHEMSKQLKLAAKLLAASPKNPYLRGSLTKTSKDYKKLLRRKKIEHKKQLIQQLEVLEERNPKEYWNLVNELREKKQNKTMGNPEEFTAFFEKLYAADTGKNKHIQDYVDSTLKNIPPSDLTKNFTIEELQYALKKLKKNKSAGPDGIPGEVFKNSPDNLLNLILKIINKIKTKNHYPIKWALGITTLLLKDGNDEDPNNYRAITVSDTISKILAMMINERLEKWYSKTVRPEQIGFKKTQDQQIIYSY